MSLEAVLKVLSDISMADQASYWMVGTLTLLVVVVMRAMLPVKSLSLIFAPVIFWGGLTGIYTARMAGFVAMSDKNANIVATSALGMIAAMVLLILLMRFIQAVTVIRKPLVQEPDRTHPRHPTRTPRFNAP